MRPKELETRLIEFVSRILDMVESLPSTLVAKHLGSQVLRSCTSPALNYGEAQSAESRADFIHKMKICLKELRETAICLKIIEKRDFFPKGKLTEILRENEELISIFVASTKTANRK